MKLHHTVKMLACILLVITYGCADTNDTADLEANQNQEQLDNQNPPPVDNTDPTQEQEVDQPSNLTVEVNYYGEQEGNLLVTLFTSWPPAGPPSKFTDIQGVQFPAMATIPQVDPGTWTVAVVLDVEPFSPMQQGPEDLVTVVEVKVPTAGPIQVVLADNNEIPTEPEVEIEEEEEEEVILPPSDTGLRFRRITVDSDAWGPAFGKVEDVNGDGKGDLIVSKLGQVTGFSLPKSIVSVYIQGATVEDWNSYDIVSLDDEIVWANDISMEDVDGDGDLDAFVPYGFFVCSAIPGGSPCGGLAWFEQSGSQWIRHDIVPNGSTLFYHKALLTDLDGDGIKDLISVGEEKKGFLGDGADRAAAVWFKGNTSADRFEKTPRTIGAGLGSLPVLYDIDQDGDMDIASGEYFHDGGASYTWYEQVVAPSATNPSGSWTRHIIDTNQGPTIQLSIIDDFYGDGAPIAIGSNHTNTTMSNPDPWPSSVVSYRIPADPTQPWIGTVLTDQIVSVPGSMTAPQAAPGVFGWGDVDGDADHDLIVAGDGDPRVFLFEQLENEEFVIHILEQDLGMTGGMVFSDVNNNGSAEILVNSYDQNAVYLYVADENGPYPVGILSAPEGWVEPEEDITDPETGETNPGQSGNTGDFFVSNGNPFEAGPLATESMNFSAGTSGAPTDMMVFAPTEAGTYAVVVFSHGFLMANSYYSETLDHLASHGFVVVAPQTHQPGGLPIGKPSSEEEAGTLDSVLNWIPGNLENVVSVDPDVSLIGLAGHSRGAKLAWIILQDNPNLGVAVAGLDPVDGGGIFTFGDISALDQSLPAGMASLIIGSGRGEESGGLLSPACAPEGQNHVQFYEMTQSPAWYILATDAGHMDFLDADPAGCGFECGACVSGNDIDNNRQTAMGALTAFFRGQLQGDTAALDYLTDIASHPAATQVDSK